MSKSDNQEIVFSIVIPHYNLVDCLRRCIQSIPSRPDVEVIVVDDVSDLDCINQLKVLQTEYKQVSFIYSKYKGYGGRARNIGVAKARGRYVLFCDADDFFSESIGSIFDDYKDDDSDLIFFKTKVLDEKTLQPLDKTHQVNHYIDLWNTDPAKAELYLRYMFGEPWCKLIKRDIIVKHQIRFDEVRINNDTTFSYLVGYYAQTVKIDKRELYNYLIRSGSTSRQRDLDRLYIKIDVFGRSELFFKEHMIPLHEDRQYLALNAFVKNKDSKRFKNGFKHLLELGYSSSEIRKQYSIAVCKGNFLTPIWNCLFAPDNLIRFYCLFNWFAITLPRFVKYKLLGLENNELTRY